MRRKQRTFEQLERRTMLDGHLSGALAEVTQKIADLNPEGSHANIVSSTLRDDGTLLFLVAARDDESASLHPGYQTAEISLWSTDGRESASKIVDVEDSGNLYYDLGSMVSVGDSTYFFVERRKVTLDPDGCEVQYWPDFYHFDNDTRSTTLVNTFRSNCTGATLSADYTLQPIDEQRVFVRESKGSAGTYRVDFQVAEGTTLAPLQLPQFVFEFGLPITQQVELNGDLLFGAAFGETDTGLFRLDLASMEVQKIRQFEGISLFGIIGAEQVVRLNDQVVFRANPGGRDVELWRSDGTTEGTTLIKDLDPTPAEGSWPSLITTVNDTVYFFADTPEHGRELWKTDGTEEGTVLVRDITEGPESTQLSTFSVGVDGLFYFAVRNEDTSLSLWRSNGTKGGTFALTDFENTIDSPGPKIVDYKVADGRLFISTGELASFFETFEPQIWMTDGSVEGTQLAIAYESDSGRFDVVGDHLVFQVPDEEGDVALWNAPIPENRRADTDNNGAVDFQDFLVLSENFGEEVERGKRDGDLDRNGVVNFADFLILVRAYDG